MYNDSVIKIKHANNVFSIKESHLHQHSQVTPYLQEAISQINVSKMEIGDIQKVEINLGQIIGKTTCVKISPQDNVFYAQRRGRKTMTAMVYDVEAQDCDSVTIVLAKKDNCKFKILTSYIGHMAQREPLDPAISTPEEFEASKAFWATHALLAKEHRYYSHTVTKHCPWDSFDNRMQLSLGKNNDVLDMISKMRENNIKPTLDLTN